MASIHTANGSKPYIVEDRPMISRSCGDRVKITHTIEPGKEETGCITCFYSPPDYPILAKCPCFDYPEYIVNEVKASQYIYLRENSIEFNQPTITPAKSHHPPSPTRLPCHHLLAQCLTSTLCCGNSPTDLTVRDDISVIYYDDVMFDTVRNDTRVCHEGCSFVCGGRGEEVRLESRFCGGLCYRGRGRCGGGLCVPVGCPECLCPCGARKTIYVEDAATAVKIITKARDDARIRLQVMER